MDPMMAATLQQVEQMMGSGCSGVSRPGGDRKRLGEPLEKGEGKKRAKGGPPGGPKQRAEVRYDDTYTAQEAVKQLNNSLMFDTEIKVEMDEMSKDGTRVKVSNIPSEAGWQEIKDHFGAIGRVAFADIKGAGKGGGGRASNMPVTGIVRYDTTEQALAAIEGMNGHMMGDRTLEVKMHGGTTDKTKIQIFGMPPGTEWQDLKDHFKGFGRIAFCETLEQQERKGIVRYDDPAHAQQACQELNATKLGGMPITLELDRSSRDLTRIIVHGIPTGIAWQELKDHFSPIGRVAHCDINDKGSGKGRSGGSGGGSGGGDMMDMMNSMMGMGKMKPAQMQMMTGMFGQMMDMITMMKGGSPGGCGKGSKGGKGGGNMMSAMMGGGDDYDSWGGSSGASAGPPLTGQVAFANPMHAQFAIQMLDKSTLRGSHINVDWDATEDGALWVGNVPPGTTEWDLSEHFSSIGLVSWTTVTPVQEGSLSALLASKGGMKGGW